MAYEFLKKLFGEAKDGEEPKAMTYDQLEAAIDADKDLKLVDLSAGGYVAKNKFDAKETELTGVKKQLEDANETIGKFKDQDIDGIKKKVSDWEVKYNTDTQTLKDQLAAQQRSHAEEMFMTGYKFTSKPAREGVLNAFRSQKFKLDDNGTFQGADKYMEDLMQNDDYKGAFVVEEKEDPQDGGDGNNKPENNGGNGGNNFPRFAGGTNGGSGKETNPFLAAGFGAGFTHLRQPKED